MSMLNMLLGSGAKTELAWSGNSYSYNAAVQIGLETSGNLHRYKKGATYVGAWVSVSLSGIFSGNSSIMSGIVVLEGSGNSLRISTNLYPGTMWISYNSATKTFSTGMCDAQDESENVYTLQGSGGLLRYSDTLPGDGAGQYISLT